MIIIYEALYSFSNIVIHLAHVVSINFVTGEVLATWGRSNRYTILITDRISVLRTKLIEQ